MFDEQDVIGLMRAYIAGDVLARKVLVDALEEAGDARAAAVRAEDIDWDALAVKLAGEPRLAPRSRRRRVYVLGGNAARLRWLIDCARVGSTTTAEVMQAVSEARREWLKTLFPEVGL
jgi:hypothetical protein